MVKVSIIKKSITAIPKHRGIIEALEFNLSLRMPILIAPIALPNSPVILMKNNVSGFVMLRLSFRWVGNQNKSPKFKPFTAPYPKAASNTFGNYATIASVNEIGFFVSTSAY